MLPFVQSRWARSHDDEVAKKMAVSKEGEMLRRRSRILFLAAFCIVVLSFLSGCASVEFKKGWGVIPRELPDADRAIDSARQANRDYDCPAQFNEAEGMRNKAYELYRQCDTYGAQKMARDAKAMADKPCPPRPAAPAPPKDSDSDGVPDNLDKCPDTPKGVPVDSTGCPKDSDGDGVPDYLDQCPDTLQGIQVDEKGCPVPIKEKVSIELHVEFAFDSAVVKNVYHDHIQKVANFLKTYPETIAVVEGHTDSIGAEDYNLGLSQKRAENVVKHMIDFGIDPSRLKAVGHGESQPIADNKTKEGRQKNRRVVTVITTTVVK